tara:strand:+ start:145 stop:603 length:459 start_codon:yes stop_codon:yes gene_type:complete
MKILGIHIPEMIMKLCKPAQVYLILSLIGVVLYVISMLDVHDKILQAEPEGEGIHHYTMSGLLLNILFTIVWVFLLNYICQFKYGKKIAWFIVLLPFFFMGLMLIGLLCAVSFIALQSSKNKELQNALDSKNTESQKTKPKMKEEQLSELLR